MPTTDLTLAIETSNPGTPHGPDASDHAPGVCLLRGSDTQGHAPITPKQRHDDALLPAIDTVCRDAGVRPRDLTRVGVSVGPGGYTAIRIGVTVAKTIAEATGCACVPVPTALAIAHSVAPDDRALVALAWKREDVWVQAYDNAKPAGEGRIVPIAQLAAISEGRVLIAEDRLYAQIEHAEARRAPVFSARSVGLLARELDPVDPAHLLPLYPREPEAVRKWRAMRR